MSKKVTLKHTVDGVEFTRTTARNYTHVVVARRNPEMVRAKAENDYNQAALEKVIADATYNYKYESNLRKVPVGEKFFYRKGQGGYYLNRTGKHMTVEQYHHDIADKYVLCFETLESYVDSKIAEFFDKKAKAIAAADSDEVANDTWGVVSWHGRKDLAEKAASSDWKSACCDTRVEAING